jgi:hypothetical protein
MTKNLVTENIEKIIERGEHIDLLVERTGQLAVRLHSTRFARFSFLNICL